MHFINDIVQVCIAINAPCQSSMVICNGYIAFIVDSEGNKITVNLNILEHGRVTALAFSPRGDFLASGLDTKKVAIWDWPSCKLRGIQTRHTGAITHVAVTDDGNYVISGSDDGTIQVWDAVTVESIRCISETYGAIAQLVVLPDDQVVSSTDTGDIRIWDINTGKNVSSLEGHSGKVHDMALTPDMRFLVSAGQDSTVRVWDWRRAKQESIFYADGPVTKCGVSPDGAVIVAAEQSGIMHFLAFENMPPTPVVPTMLLQTKDARLKRKKRK